MMNEEGVVPLKDQEVEQVASKKVDCMTLKVDSSCMTLAQWWEMWWEMNRGGNGFQNLLNHCSRDL